MAFETRQTHQAAERHDDLRDETLSHMFVRSCKGFPGLKGIFMDYGGNMPVLCNVTDGGKTNKNNNISYNGVIPNKNPLFCPIFARAALLFYRFKVKQCNHVAIT